MNDLVLKGGRVVDPSQGLDKITDIAFANGRVSAIGSDLSGKDARSVAGKRTAVSMGRLGAGAAGEGAVRISADSNRGRKPGR